MKQTCFRIEKDENLSVIPCADLPALLAEAEADYWQEIETATPDELASWLKLQALHQLMVEDILTAQYSTLVDRYDDVVYIEFPTNLGESDDGLAYLSIILKRHLIATIQRGENPGMPALMGRFQQEIRPPVARTIAVLYHILDHFVDQGMQLTLNLRNRIDSMEQLFANQSTAVDVEAVTNLKRETTALISIAEDQHYCVKALETMHLTVLDFTEYRTYVRDITTNVEQVLRMLGRSEERLKDLKESYQLAVNNTSEKRLRMLTVLSAVFLPLTLIAGIFGMNFTGMILLDRPYGIWLALAAMVTILLLLIWYFYREGWFE